MTHRNIASGFFFTRSSNITTTARIGACIPMNIRTKIVIANARSEFPSVARVGSRSSLHGAPNGSAAEFAQFAKSDCIFI